MEIKTYFVPKQAWIQLFCELSTVVVGNTWNSTGANITSSDSVGKCLRSLSSFGSAEMRRSLATLHFTHITRPLREISPHICQNFCCWQMKRCFGVSAQWNEELERKMNKGMSKKQQVERRWCEPGWGGRMEEDGKGGSYEDDIGGMRGVKEWICARQR